MSGHSKWASIKHKKAANDAKRGKLFTKLLKEVTVAARNGGGDPEMNPRLRTAIQAAKAANVPNDTVDRAILKGTGDLEGIGYEEVVYEGYGPNGVALIIEVLTDNKNRSVSDLRNILDRNGGAMGERGCVSWMFEKRGLIFVQKDSIDEDELFLIAADAGAEDLETQEEQIQIICPFEDFESVRVAIKESHADISLAETTMVPQTTIKLDEKQAEQMIRLMDLLDDNDDVQKVYANFDIPDDILEAA
ncbi:TPA: YebC/PmpR family DNA-binding transcriptional regulator [Candidatus Poribacteria bacterium]|nr:YebC/PmpR family DNA-binding transcriptional regulator [Candidatus Poribacteria bacterium]HIB86010.1 YebC/PmpR family DNA-binding transcriptional regulator [Candidatus Poribacteria bacterium]HIC00463.1 YebC/PmpR family DNA-binding transcriptional regulator [Candidatus Poribacteria bacterium]HIN30421.1 YebC/PmpR family DNA-binding transcriptional regulator [Candidatus Poribacteria bacterium]HIO46954.1 YebC/PmpR family DNA-binding transcriptional regulator [Candidatus Poribacteria bacterium]